VADPGKEAESVLTMITKSTRWFVLILFVCLPMAGCRQMPTAAYEKPEGVDATFEVEERDDTIPIEKELAAPKGFFNRKGGPYAGWSSEAREIEKSLGVRR